MSTGPVRPGTALLAAALVSALLPAGPAAARAAPATVAVPNTASRTPVRPYPACAANGPMYVY
ncbi:hypothetical protein AB0A67_14340, partial [Streptomyces eurythermus]